MSETEPVLPLSHAPESGAPTTRIEIPTYVDTWDEYFLNFAVVASIKSKDPRCSVGAVIISKENVLLSTGFNGLPRGVYDDDQTLLNVDEKLRMVCHAEHNAILNAARIGVSLNGATIYVTKFPCLTCCIAIDQAGIKKIYTHDKEYWRDDPFDPDHSRKKRVLHQAGIEVIAPFHPDFSPTVPITVPKKRPARSNDVESTPTKIVRN
jgi:dCMP deaminase